jgi:uncharacterized protein (TIGR02246 family)
MDAWCRGDAEGYAANAGEDLSFTNIRGQHWTGRDAFVKVHDSIFRGVYAGSPLEAEVERVSFAPQQPLDNKLPAAVARFS